MSDVQNLGVAQFGSALPWGGRGRRFKSCHSDHNWTPVLIQCVSKRVSSFFLQKSLFARVFLYFLTIAGSTVILIQSPWSLFRFPSLYLLTKGLWGVQISVGGVHFEQKGVHLLIIPQERKIRSQSPFTKKGVRPCDLMCLLRSNLDFCTVLEYESNLTVPVDDGFFNHHRPDGIIPFLHHFWLLFEGADVKCHFAVGLTSGGA